MAVATANEKITANCKITQYDHDPNATTATDVAWVDMGGYGSFLVSFFRTVGTSNLTFSILANSESDGSGTDVTVKTKTLDGVQPDAVGDYTFLEVTEQEVKQAGVDAGQDVRYVSANLTLATGTDEGVVTYVLDKPRFAYSGLTEDNIT